MAYTRIVAIYRSFETARDAERELLSNGFSRENVEIAANSRAGVQTGGSRTVSSEHEGGISGFFHRLFGSDVDEKERGHYERAVESGSAVVTVTANDTEIDRATEILDGFDPVNLDETASIERTFEQTTAPRSDAAANAIPVVEETLQVGKRAVQRGGVRVYSRTVESPVEEQITLREERARVERRAVDRAATQDDLQSQDRVIEVIETVEEPVIAKQARVVEEVIVGKQSSERTEKVRDTVRHTDVEVENIGTETEPIRRS